MNWWLIIFLILLVVTVIGLVAMTLVDDDYGYAALVTFILMWIEGLIYIWYRTITFTIDRVNGETNSLDWVEVLGFISILAFIFGSTTRSSSS